MRAVWYAALLTLVPAASLVGGAVAWLDGSKFTWTQAKESAGACWFLTVAGVLFYEAARRFVTALRSEHEAK